MSEHTGFYKEGMRIKPHPDVPGVYGTVTEADDEYFTIQWDDGDYDTSISQTASEEPDMAVDK